MYTFPFSFAFRMFSVFLTISPNDGISKSPTYKTVVEVRLPIRTAGVAHIEHRS